MKIENLNTRIANIDLPTRMGAVAYKLSGRHASFKRFCKLFNIDLGKNFNKDHHISNELSNHLFKFEIFARLYEMDYYKEKSPEIIANFLGKNTDDVIKALRNLEPQLFSPIGLMMNKEYNFKYISSFEIDKYLGGNYDFLSYREI